MIPREPGTGVESTAEELCYCKTEKTVGRGDGKGGDGGMEEILYL